MAKFKQYLKLENGKITLPRHFATKRQDAEMWGEGNFLKTKLDDGVDPYCYDDTPANVEPLKGRKVKGFRMPGGFTGDLVLKQSRVDEVNQAIADWKIERDKVEADIIFGGLVDIAVGRVNSATVYDSMTDLEKYVVFKVGIRPSDAELQTYMDAV